MKSIVSSFASVLVLLAIQAGCSSGSAGDSGGSVAAPTATNSNTATDESGSFCCGVNGSYFDCPSEAALSKCGDLSNPDPSSCKPRGTACTGASPTKSEEKGKQGAACTTDSQCASSYTCVRMSAGNPSICMQTCDDNINCDLNYHCCGLANVVKNVCAPENFDNGRCMK